MDELKSHLFTSFISGIGKTSGGLLITGVFFTLWNLYNENYSYTYTHVKSRETQTDTDFNSESNHDFEDGTLYKKIFDQL